MGNDVLDVWLRVVTGELGTLGRGCVPSYAREPRQIGESVFYAT